MRQIALQCNSSDRLFRLQNMRQTQVRTRAKICGITRAQDIHAVVQAGADAIGLVFFPPSPRHVSIEQAQTLAKLIPPHVQYKQSSILYP